MGLLRNALISMVLTLLLAKYLYQPLPPGLAEPPRVRAVTMAVKLLMDTVS